MNKKYRRRTIAKYEKMQKSNELVKVSRLGDYINKPIFGEKEIIIETNIVGDYISDVDLPVKEEPKKARTNVFESIKNRKKAIKEYPNAEVVFDGVYKLMCDGDLLLSEPIDDVLLEFNATSKKFTNNINIIRMLQKFDKEKNSNLCSRYKNKDLPVYYDLKVYERLKDDAYATEMIKKLAKKEAKKNKNVTVRQDKKIDKFKVGFTAVCATAMLALGSLGFAGKLQRNKVATKTTTTEATTKLTTEAMTEELTTEEVTTATTESIAMEKEVINTEVVSIPEEKPIVETIESEIREEPQEEITDITVENTEPEFKIGDTVELENTDLYYSSTDELPRGNTSYLNNYSYKATLISVVYGDKVMELVYNDSISLTELEKVCKEKYGEDVKISVNFDLVDGEGNVVTNYVGWVNSSDIKAKSKVLSK